MERSQNSLADRLRSQNSLADRLRRGNRAAATELVDAYYEQIYLYMRRLGHNRQSSEDLTQESFLQAWQHIEQLRSSRALGSWLYRIAGNVSRQYWRKNKIKASESIEETEIPYSGEAEEKAGNYEQLKCLQSALIELPIKSRQVVVLHYMQQMTIAEAAEAAGIKEGTFKSRLNRALQTLRKQII